MPVLLATKGEAQDEHEVDPALEAMVPMPHCTHEERSGLDILPAGHVLHDVAEVKSVYLPNSHDLQYCALNLFE